MGHWSLKDMRFFKGHQLKCYSWEPVSQDMTNEFSLQEFVSFLF